MWTRQLTKGTLLEQVDIDQESITQSMQLVNLEDGSAIKVFDKGKGEPIIFVPTVPELHFVYAPQIEEFSRDHRVILYDPRLSRESFVRVSDRSNEIILLMKALGLNKAHIVAWSDAGSVAYLFAKESPDKCKSAIFLGLADKYVYPEPLHALSRLLLNFPIENSVPSSMIASILAKYLGGTEIKPEWIKHRASAIPQLPRYFKYSILPCMADHQPSTGEVNISCSVICGDNDALVSVLQAQRMAKMLTQAGEAVIIPGGEHLLSYANAKAVNLAMRDYYLAHMMD